VEKRKKELNKI